MSKSGHIVGKFGGTSMADATAIKQVAAIVIEKKINLVVVSAVSGVTNTLEKLGTVAHTQSWSKTETALNEVAQKHYSIASDLGVNDKTDEKLATLVEEAETLARGMYLLKESPQAARDRLMSIGERSSSLLLSQYLRKLDKKTELLDARLIVTTDGNHGKANPYYDSIASNATKKVLPLLRKHDHIVTQGFIGRSREGNTTTLGRGGSDFSAAIFAEAIKAQELQIWSDVSGIASTDPRIVKNVNPLQELTYGEAAELAAAGAKILYPPTVIPTHRSNIPIRILNTFDTNNDGTLIRDEIDDKPLIRAIALKPKQHLLTLSSPLISEGGGFMGRIFNVFAKHDFSIDLITTSETAVAITVSDEILNHDELLDDFREFLDVSIEHNVSVVSIVGNRMNHTPGVATHIFGALGRSSKGINVRMICQGAFKHAMSLVIDSEHSHEAVQLLHKALIEDREYA